jgi:hypothetical protein
MRTTNSVAVAGLSASETRGGVTVRIGQPRMSLRSIRATLAALAAYGCAKFRTALTSSPTHFDPFFVASSAAFSAARAPARMLPIA